MRTESPLPVLGADLACLDSVESTGSCDTCIQNRAFESDFAKIVITELSLCGLSDFVFNFYLYLPVLVEKERRHNCNKFLFQILGLRRADSLITVRWTRIYL